MRKFQAKTTNSKKMKEKNLFPDESLQCPTGGPDPRVLKTALFCISFLRKGEVLACVGSIQNLKDLKDLEVHTLASHREPSALYCWVLESLYCNPKGRRALLRIPSTEGRIVCLCWAKSKPEGSKGLTVTVGVPLLISDA